jgi:hypothetical protein
VIYLVDWQAQPEVAGMISLDGARLAPLEGTDLVNGVSKSKKKGAWREISQILF